MKRELMKDKRGLELAINTLVVMVLAIVLLAALIFFFTGSFSNFSGKIKGYSSYSNVDSVIEGCNILVDTEREYSFCCEKKEVNYLEDGEKEKGDFTCDEFADRFGGVEELNCGEVSC